MNNTIEELEKLSYMYPSAITIIIVVIALLVLYVTGRSLAYVFKTTEEKLKAEPSVLTELDELRTANKQLSYHCDKYKDLIDSRMTTIRKRDGRIAELEKELSDLRSSCDDSFINTVERANQLSLKSASLENTIAEFDVYKKDAQEVHDKLTKLYESEQTIRNNLSSKLWHSRREVAKLKRDLAEAAMQIAELGGKYTSSERERGEYESMYNSILTQYAELKVKLNAIEQDKPKVEPKLLSDLSWVKWIAKEKSGNIWAYSDKPETLSFFWDDINNNKCEAITNDTAVVLCDRVPEWADEEPTYVGKNL